MDVVFFGLLKNNTLTKIFNFIIKLRNFLDIVILIEKAYHFGCKNVYITFNGVIKYVNKINPNKRI